MKKILIVTCMKGGNHMVHKVILKMIDYNYGCPELVNHALKVYGFAKTIGEAEHLPEKKQTILELSAILHDIGIRPSEVNINLVQESIRKWKDRLLH